MRSHDLQATPPATSTRAAAGLRGRLARACAVAALSLTAGACSVSYPLYDRQDEITTGSVTPAGAPEPAAAVGRPESVVSAPLAAPRGAEPAAEAQAQRPVAYAPPRPADPGASAITPADWAYARGALSLAMGADAIDASVPWANPDTGAYGSFKAAAASVVERGATCRDFAASHSGGGREQRLEGVACRTAAGHWEAVSIRATASRTL